MIDKTSQIPRYYQLKEILKAEIKEKYQPGELFLSQRELMHRFSLAYATVGRTMGELVREGLLCREQGKGTFVTGFNEGKQDELKRVKNIAVSFLDIYGISHPYLSIILKGVSEVCNKESYHMQLLATSENAIHHEKHTYFTTAIAERRIAGLVGASKMGLRDILLIKEAKIPFVWLMNDIPGEDLNCILVDPFIGTCQAMEYLIKRGHKKIGLITGPRTGRGAPFILSGYKVSLRRYDLRFDSHIVQEGDYREETSYGIMQGLLSSPETRITGLFVADDLMAVGAARAAIDKGLKVPGDIDIIGGGNYLPLFSSPLLGSIDTRAQEMGRLGAQMLIKLIEGEEVEEAKVVLEPKLVIRQGAPNL